MSNIIIFDTETTGLLKPSPAKIDNQPYIIELYAIRVEEINGEFRQMGKLHSLIKPPIPLPGEITKITGITEHDLKNAPSFTEVWRAAAEFFTGADTMVAHNLSFDRSMMANELLRAGKLLNFPWPVNHICTVEKSIYIEQRRMSLTRLHEYLFGKGFNAHRAEDDVTALYSCFKELYARDLI